MNRAFLPARPAFPGLSPAGSRVGTDIAREHFALRGNPQNLLMDENAVALVCAQAADEALMRAIERKP